MKYHITYKIIEGPESYQGSESWLKFKKGKISASMAPPIMGESPWQTPLELWESIIFDRQKEKTPAMERGTKLEPIAREALIERTGLQYGPVVVQSIEHPWLIASLDGYYHDPKNDTVYVAEIKCPGEEDHAKAIKGEIPDKYYAQLQHQMMILDVPYMTYYSFDGKEGYSVGLARDEEYCKKLLIKEMEFYQSLIDMRAPAPTERDWVEASDTKLKFLTEEYQRLSDEIESRTEMRDSLRKDILILTSHPLTKCGKVYIQQVNRKGDIDWAKFRLDHEDIDFDEYRKQSINYWKIGY